MNNLDLLGTFVTKGTMSDTEQILLVQENQTQYYKSDFAFLNEHKGWRKGKTHTVVAPTHSGKSTLTRSLVWDFLNNTDYERCLVWLSEESAEDFKTEFAKLRLPPELTSRLVIASEQDIAGDTNHKKILFAETLNTVSPEIIFFDNVTTSCFYASQRPQDQASFANYLKKYAKDLNVPLVVIAHSGGDIGMNRRLIELNDIRGGKDIVNITEFAYILQRFRVVDPATNKEHYFPTIRIEKHRGYVCDNLLFKLRFNPLTVTFMEDKAIPFEAFKEAFNSQLKL